MQSKICSKIGRLLFLLPFFWAEEKLSWSLENCLMNTMAAQCSPWLCMNGFRSLPFCLPLKKKKKCLAILFFQANFEQCFLMVVPAALHADPLSALTSSQLPKETAHNKQVSEPWIGCDTWVCGTYPTDILMSLQHVSIFPLFRTTCQQVPRKISSSTGSFLLSSWAAVIGSDQAELCAFAWERGTFTVSFQYYFRVDLISLFHF